MNDEEKKNLMSETKATQEEIDAHKPSKTIKFIAFLLTIILIGAVVGPVTFIYYSNKAEDERIAEEERRVQEEINHRDEEKVDPESQEEVFNPNLEVELFDYSNMEDFIPITNGEDKLEKITAKDDKVTFQVNITRNEDIENIAVLMNDKEIYNSPNECAGIRFFKYKDTYVFEISKMCSQLTNYDSYIYDINGNKIGELVNSSYLGYEKEFTEDAIIVQGSNSIFGNDCQSNKDDKHEVEKTTMKYRLNGTSLTKYEVETKYCFS